MNKTITAALLGLVSSGAVATPLLHPSGSILTVGEQSSARGSYPGIANPAASAALVGDGQSAYRIGLIGSLGAGYELGPVDNFIDDLNRLADNMNADNLTLQQAQDTADEFNNIILPKMGRDGYARLHGSLSVPGMPLVFTTRALGGGLSFDISAAGLGGFSVLDAPVAPNPIDNSLDTATSLYLKAAVVTQLGAGYSRQVSSLDAGPVSGRVFAGGRLRYSSVGLRKTVAGLMASSDVSQTLQDEFTKPFNYQAAVSVDAGVLIVGDNYQIGATVVNLNTPKVSYDPIGVNCTDDGCWQAQSFADRIDLYETWYLDPQMKLEGAITGDNRNWMVGFNLDLNAANNPLGDLVQNLVVSTAFQPDSYLIPSVRAGYTKNLAGTGMSHLGLGMTLFNSVQFDLAYGLESVTISGNSVPRTLSGNLGFHVNF